MYVYFLPVLEVWNIKVTLIQNRGVKLVTAIAVMSINVLEQIILA